jgi:hypothetical protein
MYITAIKSIIYLKTSANQEAAMAQQFWWGAQAAQELKDGGNGLYFLECGS